MNDQDFRTIRCGPVKLALLCLIADATPENGVIDAEAAQNLRHLRDMPERIRQITNAHGLTEVGSAPQAELQVAHQRLAAHQKLVRLQIPGANQHATRPDVLPQPFLLLRLYLKIIIENDGLPIEHEMRKAGVALQNIQ